MWLWMETESSSSGALFPSALQGDLLGTGTNERGTLCSLSFLCLYLGCDLLAYLVPKVLLRAPAEETANKQSVMRGRRLLTQGRGIVRPPALPRCWLCSGTLLRGCLSSAGRLCLSHVSPVSLPQRTLL